MVYPREFLKKFYHIHFVYGNFKFTNRSVDLTASHLENVALYTSGPSISMFDTDFSFERSKCTDPEYCSRMQLPLHCSSSNSLQMEYEKANGNGVLLSHKDKIKPQNTSGFFICWEGAGDAWNQNYNDLCLLLFNMACIWKHHPII